MNALVSASYEARQHQNFLNPMTLVRYDEDLELQPYLAESWELSANGREVTFHLRDDVRWHDGERTDAHDVAFTYRRATDPTTGFPNPAYWRYYEHGEAGVEVLDSLTVRFRMRPHVQPLSPWASMAILPEHLLGSVPPAELRRHPYGSRCPVGNGPFVFEEHRQNESWSFTANPWFPEGLGGRPHLDRYVLLWGHAEGRSSTPSSGDTVRWRARRFYPTTGPTTRTRPAPLPTTRRRRSAFSQRPAGRTGTETA